LYNELLHNYKFGPAHCVELLKRSPTKLSLQFLDLPTSFYRFWKFELFLGILLNQNKTKNESHWAVISAQGHSAVEHGGPHASRPMAEAVLPAWSGTAGLVQPLKQPGRPAAERPTGPRRRAWASVRSRAVTARECGVVA
jgi:hypothetical protein